MSANETVSDNLIYERLTEQIHNNPALLKLSMLAKESCGLVLVVLLHTKKRMVELHSVEGEDWLPLFCRHYRNAVQGKKRCLTCRSLVFLGARYRGLIEYSCHGGVSVVAAPALRRDGAVSERIVVASSAFVDSSYTKGWPLAKKHSASLGLDLKELKQSYYKLPEITDENRRLAMGIVDAAASVLGEVEERIEQELPGGSTERDQRSAGGVNFEEIRSAFSRIKDVSFRHEGESAVSFLVNLVIAMVNRDPSMRYSQANIARATCITPNHFSMLFHKHTGQTFRDFLTERRIELARDLLSDPGLSVAEVAYGSGFDDPAYFSRRFKQVTGTTPTQWRGSLIPPFLTEK